MENTSVSIPNKYVRKRGGELFKELSLAGKIPVKIVPVRFPVAEETYEVEQAIQEPMGMVERYILKAICEFDPCSTDDIANLLSLDRSLVDDMIEGLIKDGVDLDKNETFFSPGQSLRASLEIQRLSKRVRHRRTFVVNPLTGDLLPITFINESGRWMFPFGPDDEKRVSTDWLRVFLGDRAISGRRSLVHALASMDTSERNSLGIPEGSVAISDEACVDRNLHAVLAFAVVTQELNVAVYSAADFSLQLSNEDASNLDYWNRCCHDVQPWVFATPDSSGETAKFFAQNLDGVQCRAVDSCTLAVSVQSPNDVLVVDSQNAPSDSSEMHMLQMDLVNGWYWKRRDFGIMRLIAGDAATESRLFILQSIAELRKVYRQHKPNDSMALSDWFKERKDHCACRFGGEAEIEKFNFNWFLEEAEQVPDTRFLDWLDDIVNDARK